MKVILFALLLALFCQLLASQAQAAVLINEVLPYPEDGVEAIELVYVARTNPSSTSINLENWTISDRLRVIYTFQEEELHQGEFMVKTFYNRLRNLGDSIIIKNAEGEIVDHFEYENSQIGVSYSRVSFNSSEFVETPPTIGAPNNIVPTPTPTSVSTPITHTSDSVLSEQPPLVITQKEPVNNSSNDQLMGNQTLHSIENSELAQQIMQKREEVSRLLHSSPTHLENKSHNSLFTHLLIYEAQSFSNTSITGVIIAGMLFLMASRLIYE